MSAMVWAGQKVLASPECCLISYTYRLDNSAYWFQGFISVVCLQDHLIRLHSICPLSFPFDSAVRSVYRWIVFEIRAMVGMCSFRTSSMTVSNWAVMILPAANAIIRVGRSPTFIELA